MLLLGRINEGFLEGVIFEPWCILNMVEDGSELSRLREQSEQSHRAGKHGTFRVNDEWSHQKGSWST